MATETQSKAKGEEAKDAKGKDAKGKSAKAKNAKGKPAKGKGKQSTAFDDSRPSIAAHPRAARQVARAKSFGGLVGFLLGAYLSASTHTLVETGTRAVVAGIVCYLAVWAAAVFVWRRLLVLEIRDRKQELLDAAYAGVSDTVE